LLSAGGSKMGARDVFVSIEVGVPVAVEVIREDGMG